MSRLHDWRPPAPPLPEHLRGHLQPGDPAWFARELTIAAAPHWWFWRVVLRSSSWLPGLFGRIVVTGGVPAELRGGPLLQAVNHMAAALTRGLAPLRAGEPTDRIAFGDPTRPTTRTAAFPGGVVPDDIP